ncbi:MAG TPA: zinc-binding dehydrogenase, partial [Mycobacterium sp.]
NPPIRTHPLTKNAQHRELGNTPVRPENPPPPGETRPAIHEGRKLPLGADAVAVGEKWRAQLDGPVQMIVDPVGGDKRFRDSLRALAPEGRVVVVGFAAGEIPTVAVNWLLLRNVDVRGCSFGVLAIDPAVRESAVTQLQELAVSGAINPLIGAVYPLEDIGSALGDLAERRSTGKVVVEFG